MTERVKNTRKNLKEGGITLIALVITIIVLLILAGVALSLLTGDNGILSNAENAKENTLEANAKEKVQIAIMEHKIGQYSEGKTLKEYLEEAGATEVTEAGTKGKMDGYNFEIENGVVTLTKGTSETEGLRLKDVYKPEMIGQEINYKTTNTLPPDVKWIVIGQDNDGNVLATTSRPLGMEETEENYKFHYIYDADHWLTYEDDLDAKCAELFAGSVQGETVKVESMDIEHVNTLTGFEESEFNTYTFGSAVSETVDYDYWHPDKNGTEVDGNGNLKKWSKEETQYECNAYSYYLDGEDIYYAYEGNDWEGEKYTKTLNNLDLILGENYDFEYVLASCSVRLYSDSASFTIGKISGSSVSSDNGLCNGNSSNFVERGYHPSSPVRPVVYLSSEFLVEKQDVGTYKLIENVEETE